MASPPPSSAAVARKRCPACLTPSHDDDQFCEFCGQSLRERRAGTAAFLDGTEHIAANLGAVAFGSDMGLVHARNEDAVAAVVLAGSDPRGVAVVVCDGISSVSRPQEASVAAAEAALEDLIKGIGSRRSNENTMLSATAAAVRAVAALDTEGEPNPPACTFVAATVTATADGPPEVTIGWIGDSRAYWLSARADSMRLTDDDSWAAEMVRVGVLDEQTAAAHPQAHAITRWIGGDTAADPAIVTPHLRVFTPAGPGVLLVCSDGLWNYLPAADQLADIVFAAKDSARPPDLPTAVRTLIRYALDCGGGDNITVALVEIPAGIRTSGG